MGSTLDRNRSQIHGKDVLSSGNQWKDQAYQHPRRKTKSRSDVLNDLFRQGNVFREQGDFSQAVACYQKGLGIYPESTQLLNNLGLAFHGQNAYAKAIRCFAKSLAIDPACVEAHNNMANVYRDMGVWEVAIEKYRHALAIDPRNTIINYNLAIAFHMQRDLDWAARYYRNATAHHPPVADAHSNLGKLFQDGNRLREAIDAYTKAILLEPEHFDARFNRALAYLADGDFEKGWREYEWRFKRDRWKRVYPHRLAGLRWDGTPFPGKTLLVHGEQGFGDTIWFCRYLPMIKALGGKVVFEVRSELMTLMQQAFPGIDEFVPMSFDHPPACAYDGYLPLMSSAKLFSTTVKTIPADTPYLHVSQKSRKKWAMRTKGKGLAVGLVWAAGKTHVHERSCSFKDLLPLLDCELARFYGFQKGEDACQCAGINGRLDNLGAGFETFADTAGAIDCMDLIISVDTAVAHLAGAMGKPVWVLLPYAADWKWFLDREDSPWYPTMRLFRQTRAGDWATVVHRVLQELQSF